MSDLAVKVYVEEDHFRFQNLWNAMQDYKKNFLPSLKDMRVSLKALENRVLGVDYNSYSSPKRNPSWDRFEAFRAKYPIIASIFLSSTDELTSNVIAHRYEFQFPFFRNQNDWIKFVIENASDSVGYVIRLHPRLAANKRDKVVASGLKPILELLEVARQKPNFLVIEAGETISSYYLIQESAATFVGWSTVCFESVALGIPTVIAFPDISIFPVADFSPQPCSLEEYTALLRNPSSLKISESQKRDLIKWLCLYYSASGLQLPVIRSAHTKLRKLLRKIGNLFLDKAPLSQLITIGFRKKIFVSSNRELIIRPNRKASNEAEYSLCVLELEKFQGRSRSFFAKK